MTRTTTPKPPRRTSKAKAAPAPKADPDLDDDGPDLPAAADPGKVDWPEFVQPVSLTFLQKVFGMDRLTVKKKLASLSPVRHGRGNSPEYSFRQAAAYLVQPKVNLADYIATLRPNDLPPYLQSAFWDAMKKRQEYEIGAKDLWRTEHIMTSVGRAFQGLSLVLKQLPDDAAIRLRLDTEQRDALQLMVETMQRELHKTLVEDARTHMTQALAAELEEIEREQHDAGLDLLLEDPTPRAGGNA